MLNKALIELLKREGLHSSDAVQVAYVVQNAPLVARQLGTCHTPVLSAPLEAPRRCWHYHDDELGIAVWDYAGQTQTLITHHWDEVLVSTLTPCTTEHDTDMWTGQLLRWQPGDWLAHFGMQLVKVKGVVR